MEHDPYMDHEQHSILKIERLMNQRVMIKIMITLLTDKGGYTPFSLYIIKN